MKLEQAQIAHDIGQIIDTLTDHPDVATGNTRVHYAFKKAQSALAAHVVAAGFSVSGPTDHRAAEDGEPVWVCRAREHLAVRRGL